MQVLTPNGPGTTGTLRARPGQRGQGLAEVLKSDANPSRIGAPDTVPDEDDKREADDAGERANLHDSDTMSSETHAALLELLSEPEAPADSGSPRVAVGSHIAD